MSLTTHKIEDSAIAQANGQAGLLLTLATNRISQLQKGQNVAELDAAKWKRWRKHLRDRKPAPALAKWTATRDLNALSWGLPPLDASEETAQILTQLVRSKRGKNANSDADQVAIAQAWLAERAAREPDVSLAIECLAWAYALPKLTSLESVQWCELTNALIEIAEVAAGIDVERQPLLHQLLAGELALTLACILPEIEACKQLGKPGRAALAQGVTAVLDGSGEIAAEHLSAARGLLACWTRSALLGKHARKRTFKDTTALLLEWFVRQSLAMMRADGSQMLSEQEGYSRAMFDAALQHLASASERKLAKLALPGKAKRAASPKSNTGKEAALPASANSEWASTALLRASWCSDAPKLLLDYSADFLRSELCVDKHIIWSGDCSPTVRINGGDPLTGSSWHEVCWHCDEDVVYVEIEADLDNDWKCQRQFVLDRENRCLVVGDAILGDFSAVVEYSCTWPIGSQLVSMPEEETTEYTLAAGKKSVARVLPLALPEWKRDGGRTGELEETETGLHYSLQSKGCRLYAPLCLDLDPARMKYPYTWRRLTVGQELAPIAMEEAVAYRVQLRLDQWLIYRSLTKVASRTVLGQNYFFEFVCGRFERTGEVEPLIEVE